MRSDQDQNQRPEIPPECRDDLDRKVTMAAAMVAAFEMGAVVTLAVEQMWAIHHWDRSAWCMVGLVFIMLTLLVLCIRTTQNLVKRCQ